MNKTQKTLVSLTKSALFGNDTRWGEPLAAKEYEKLYRCAKLNGVLALCLDGIQHLPDSQQPGKELKMSWIANVAAIEKRYEQKKKALEILLETFRPDNIPCMIFKGFSISRLYPKPNHREFGDLDIYLYKDYMKGNTALRKRGINVHTGNHHHAQCRVNGILVENHAAFLHNSNSTFEKELEQAAQKVREENSESPLFLPPLHHAAYIAHHASQHFFCNDCNIRLRTICDWAVILQGEGSEWQYNDLKRLLRHTRESNMADMLTTICHRWYGNVPRETRKQLATFSERTIRLFVKSIFAKKYQRKDEKRKWVRYLGHIYKQIRFKPLRRSLSKR